MKITNKVHLLAENEGQPWIHEDPFTINWSENNHENEVCDVGILVDDEEVKNSTTEEETDKSIEILEDNVEIKERARTTMDHISDDDTVSEDQSENDIINDDYSSGTTIKASDSTYIPEGDVLETIEENANISASILQTYMMKMLSLLLSQIRILI